MKPFLIPVVAAAISLSVFTAAPALAQEQEVGPAAMEQIALSERLIAMGKARKDPVLILAAIRIRSSLDAETPAPGEGLTSREDAFAAAREAAAGDEAMTGVIEDIEASGSRRMCIYARNGVCF